eukprot:TRINITY_DN47973_c0_g1_i1.p1 TRINITY_DN47973_c0_g1~~TRINITY_DN47973_c0_g1_i1.p1  ORF type:complete len:246 (+),score=26.21 TRINITY_DN47973_c0_g1_i1:75-812(+)
MDACGVICQVELLNAVTMVPPILVLAGASACVNKPFWLSKSTMALVAAWILLLPGSFSNHLYAAFNGEHSSRLLRLDQAGIAASSAVGSWALSRSLSFASFVAVLAVTFAYFEFLGFLREQVAWRNLLLAGFCALWLSPMVWSRPKCDPNIFPIGLCFVFGFVMAVEAPLGPYSHPLFHLALIPFAYFVGRSAVLYEQMMHNRGRSLCRDAPFFDGEAAGEGADFGLGVVEDSVVSETASETDSQ